MTSLKRMVCFPVNEIHAKLVALSPSCCCCFSPVTRGACASRVPFPHQLRRWFLRRMRARKWAKRRLLHRLSAITIQSAARAASARARCSALRATRLHLWVGRVAALYAGDASSVGGYEGDNYAPSPAGAELVRDNNTPPPAAPPGDSPIPSSPRYTATGPPPRKGGVVNSRALAEALAPRMGRPPPGCPAALDVDWGEWGVGLRLVFPAPSPRVG